MAINSRGKRFHKLIVMDNKGEFEFLGTKTITEYLERMRDYIAEHGISKSKPDTPIFNDIILDGHRYHIGKDVDDNVSVINEVIDKLKQCDEIEQRWCTAHTIKISSEHSFIIFDDFLEPNRTDALRIDMYSPIAYTLFQNSAEKGHETLRELMTDIFDLYAMRRTYDEKCKDLPAIVDVITRDDTYTFDWNEKDETKCISSERAKLTVKFIPYDKSQDEIIEDMLHAIKNFPDWQAVKNGCCDLCFPLPPNCANHYEQYLDSNKTSYWYNMSAIEVNFDKHYLVVKLYD